MKSYFGFDIHFSVSMSFAKQSQTLKERDIPAVKQRSNHRHPEATLVSERSVLRIQMSIVDVDVKKAPQKTVKTNVILIHTLNRSTLDVTNAFMIPATYPLHHNSL